MDAFRIGICFLLFLPSLARAQQFASIAIKPSVSTNPGDSHLRVLPDGHLIGTSIPVFESLGLAYAVPVNPSRRLASLPEWAIPKRFDIEAKAAAPLRLDDQDAQDQRRRCFCDDRFPARRTGRRSPSGIKCEALDATRQHTRGISARFTKSQALNPRTRHYLES